MAESAETQFFFELTPQRILNAVEASSGLRFTGRCSALNSMENRVYELEIDEEPDPKNPHSKFRVAKFYRPGRWTREQILEEHEFLLRLQDIELPVVAPLRFEDGETLRKVEEADIWYALFPKMGGRSLLQDEFSSEQWTRLGRLLARIHNVGAVTSQKHRLVLSPNSYAAADIDYLERSNVLPPNLAGRYFDAAKKICAETAGLFERFKTHALHGDFHVGNILWNSAGPLIVDFDDMVVGPPVQDLWLLLPGRGDEVRKQAELMLEAYETMRAFDRASLILIEPLRALRLIHFASWIAKRWQDPAFPRAFPHFGTERYWHEQVSDLYEQLELIQNG